VALALDGVLLEPRWLDTSVHRVEAQGLARPLRIALLADLQTDHPGAWEQRVLQATARAEPDLLLLAGDYLQLEEGEPYQEAVRALQAAFRDAALAPALGAYAVRGDIDPDGWEAIFEPLGFHADEQTVTRSLGPLVLTSLSLEASRSSEPPIAAQDRFHVVVGHAPDFALATPPADLLLAGHIHGGQVRLPFLGPPLTLSRVPTAWSAGRTEIPGGGTLIVSRGLGLERGDAPRLRINCRPELVIIDLVPSGFQEQP